MAAKKHKLADGTEIMLHAHGGVDVKLGGGAWLSVASNPQSCADLARLATLAADCKIESAEGGPTPTPAQLAVLQDAARRANGTIFIGGAGRLKMIQRCARAGWGEIWNGMFTINDAGQAAAKGKG